MNIAFTPAAEKFIRRLLRFDGGPGYGLRLLVSPGGCSGMSSEFNVEAQPREGEVAFKHAESHVVPAGAEPSSARWRDDRLQRDADFERLRVHRSEGEVLRLLEHGAQRAGNGFGLRRPDSGRSLGCGES